MFISWLFRERNIFNKFFKKKGWRVFNKKDKINKYDLENINTYDFIVSYGYRHIIKKNFKKDKKKPIINLHISYLPFNRGAYPNFWSFIDETPSGVTIHEIKSKIDSGPIIFQKKILFNIDRKKHETFSKTYKILRLELEKLFKKKFNILVNKNYKTFHQKWNRFISQKKRSTKNI